MAGSVDSDIVLVLPAEPQNVRLARLIASGVASSAGFDVEDVADFRIAVDEMCSTLLETTRHSVSLRFGSDRSGALVVEGFATGPKVEDPDAARMELAQQILDVVADRYEFGIDDGRAVFRLYKRAPVAVTGHA